MSLKWNHWWDSLVNNKNAWLLEEKITRNVIGYITVDIPYESLRIGELGYVIAEKCQHCGYVYEALTCLIKRYLYDEELYFILIRISRECKSYFMQHPMLHTPLKKHASVGSSATPHMS